MSGASRGIPFHCPYCGDENLRPSEEGHGSWECHACLRAFTLRMLGMIARPEHSRPDHAQAEHSQEAPR